MSLGPSSGPLPSRTVVVLESIKHAILTGRLVQGQPLVETELAARLGVSKTPVREALKTLAGTGLVTMSQYKGAQVRVVDAALAQSVCDVRQLLEPEALRRTVLAGVEWAAAEEALLAADVAVDPADRSQANRDFHRALYLPCGNPLLVRMLDDLRDQAALVSLAARETHPGWDRDAAEHREILDAARAGAADRAGELLRRHIAAFAEHVE
ncbi:GntR family transcriptional regulator [Phaeacidiphilus oryzae]|uniref:GntR family transcriptional regulator n=1 Tax=Phaeacidiphilus oryzae TaxID=348818 RepID=UPI0005681543|nr:GntR family transcriptional regulator [Phaeacidiphilus oryzae]